MMTYFKYNDGDVLLCEVQTINKKISKWKYLEILREFNRISNYLFALEDVYCCFSFTCFIHSS